MSAPALLWALVPPGPGRRLLLGAAACSIISAAFALVPALVIFVLAAIIFDRIDIGLSVMQVVFVGVAAVIARLGFLLLARNTAGSATEFVSQSLRARAAVTIGALPLGVLAELPAGSLETVLLDDVETVGQYMCGGLIDLIGSTAMLSLSAAVLFTRDWRWAAAAAIALALVAGLVLRLQASPAARSGRERAVRERFAAAVFASIRSLTLQTTLPEAVGELDPARRLIQDERRVNEPRQARFAGLRAGRAALATTLPAAVLVAIVALGGGSDISVLVLVAALGLRLSGALTSVLGADTAVAPALESAQRIRALLARPPMLEGTTAPPDDATLRFAGVAFAYRSATDSREVLQDIDFVAEPARVTAIVGPSGSGKTTLTRLAARLWDVDRGSVTLGGVDVRAIPLDAFMRHVACVFQDVALLNDTVAANLKLGRPAAADAEMERAAVAAGAHSFISALPFGYQTIIGDRGLHLSRGERQRLQIARALLKNAPVVILDEPTASMDPATELEVQAALAPLFDGKTVLVVAHRLGTIVGADRIVCLSHDGRIEAQGTHRELLAASPTYAGLWADYCGSAHWTPAAQITAG